MPDETEEQAVEPRVVEAVAVSSNIATTGSQFTKDDASIIEQAMSQAVEYCYSKGVTDPEIVRGKMMQAREAAKRAIMEAKQVTSEGNQEG